jgi:hypothetical protein
MGRRQEVNITAQHLNTTYNPIHRSRFAEEIQEKKIKAKGFSDFVARMRKKKA